MRKLATIRKIESIEPIPQKDRIVLAHIDGWQAIVTKDDFKVGDTVIFCEPDSVLPKKPEFEFLSKYNYRIKTIKMSGIISQGLILNMSLLSSPSSFAIGDDVTDLLGVTQYEPPMDKDPRPRTQRQSFIDRILMRYSWYRKLKDRLFGLGHTDFPDFIKKTDEERIQNHPEYLDLDCLWIGTEKLDGCSATYFLKKKKFLCFNYYEFGVCSRNIRLNKQDDSVYWRMVEQYNLKQTMKRMIKDADWMVLQGECIGRGIQKNIYRLSNNQLRIYSVITPKGRLNSSDSWDICNKYQLQHVPLLTNAAGVSLKGKTPQELLEKANGDTVLCAEPILREGIVYRSLDGERSFKAVSPNYLLKHDE
ncbi:MAG: hypothetical protein MJZ34_02280 [Paludibacteraceae bacterium]|nr:hypothetical protein [Paludibacteraceae bacterium]